MIVFEGVRKVYEPDVVALDRSHFVIDKGEFVFVVSASGSGSRRSCASCRGLDSTDGRIIVGSRDLTRLKRSVPLLQQRRLRFPGLQAAA